MKSFRQRLFQYRSYTPLPFLAVMVWFARPNVATMVAGAVVLLVGELIRYWGVAYAGPLTRVTGSVGAPELVVSGPFGYVRNPLYVGNILMYVGIGIMANALNPWLVIGAGVYFVFQYWMIVSLEEEFLAKEFGESYASYRSSVPRFIPRLMPRRTGGTAQQPDWRGGLRSERRTIQAILLVSALILARWIWSW